MFQDALGFHPPDWSQPVRHADGGEYGTLPESSGDCQHPHEAQPLRPIPGRHPVQPERLQVNTLIWNIIYIYILHNLAHISSMGLILKTNLAQKNNDREIFSMYRSRDKSKISHTSNEKLIIILE